MFDQHATSRELLHQCQKAFRKTMNEKHFGCVVQCMDKKVAEGLYSGKKKLQTFTLAYEKIWIHYFYFYYILGYKLLWFQEFFLYI